jgi:hypothetical protein
MYAMYYATYALCSGDTFQKGKYAFSVTENLHVRMERSMVYYSLCIDNYEITPICVEEFRKTGEDGNIRTHLRVSFDVEGSTEIKCQPWQSNTDSSSWPEQRMEIWQYDANIHD